MNLQFLTPFKVCIEIIIRKYIVRCNRSHYIYCHFMKIPKELVSSGNNQKCNSECTVMYMIRSRLLKFVDSSKTQKSKYFEKKTCRIPKSVNGRCSVKRFSGWLIELWNFRVLISVYIIKNSWNWAAIFLTTVSPTSFYPGN